MVLSLAIIRLLNRESRNRKTVPNPVISSFASAPVLQPYLPSNVDENTPGALLEISIEKALEYYDLLVKFHAGKGAVGLLGASGAGKTMLLEIIAGTAMPDAGSILWDDHDLLRERIQDRRMGLVYQDHALFPHMTVKKNIGYGLRGEYDGDVVEREGERIMAVMEKLMTERSAPAAAETEKTGGFWGKIFGK